jgi:siroheme synthase
VSALGTLVGTATGQAWKVATAVLASLLLVVGAGGGAAWYLTDRALTQARADLVAEQGVSAELRASIDLQNSAVDAMAASTKAADDRRDMAERYAASAIKATGAREAAARASAATNCDGVLREAWGAK